MSESVIRKSAVAGTFYPSDAEALRREIDTYLNRVPNTGSASRPLALVEPHAGYVYSGQIAAHGYRQLSGHQVDAVIIISPSHMERFPFSSVYDGDAYQTPLGTVTVDAELAREITRAGGAVRLSDRGHTQAGFAHREHALEVQLPFLQVVFDTPAIVPIVMGDQDWKMCEELGHRLAPVLRERNVVIVASSDLSHFYTSEEARRKDSVFCQLLEEMDPRRLYEAVSRRECEACGAGPVVASIVACRACQPSARCRVLEAANSGDITGDHSHVVGYVAAVIEADEPDDRTSRDTSATLACDLELAHRDYLLALARCAIERRLGLDRDDPEIPPDPNNVLTRPRDAFVTLKLRSRLRGCIGSVEAGSPLVDTIERMAPAAAFNDPRFDSLSTADLRGLRIEISVLSPLRRVDGPADILVGTHGIVVERGGRRGLLLPQVATEHGWDAETFLKETCMKAGLDADTWRDGAVNISVFEADVFSED